MEIRNLSSLLAEAKLVRWLKMYGRVDYPKQEMEFV